MAASQASPIRPVAPGAAAGIPRVIESQAHIPLVTAAPLPAGVESTPGTAQFTPGAPAPGAKGGNNQQLSAQMLANAPPGMQKQMLGEKLYPAVSRLQPELAGKITGMMLEMDNSELLMMLESEGQLRQKVDEAMRVLQQMNNK